jgi:predicted dehydrogenase
MDKVRIGFVGVGYMGQKAHLSNYAVLDDCEVVAIAEPRWQLAEKVAHRYGIEKVYKSHKELLANCQVDAIVAAQPYRHHITIVPDILEAGKPLLTEKPLALSVEAGERLAQLADEKGVLYMVGNHKRSDPAMEYAKKLVDEWKETGEYGNLRYIRVTMPPGDWIGGAGDALTSNEPYPEIQLEPDAPYFDEKMAQAYDSFVNYYIHQVNTLRFLLGEPYKVTFAEKSGVLLVAESNSGVCGIIEMAPYENTVDWQETCLVCFERGFIKVELPAPLACQQPGRVTIMKDKGKSEPLIIQPSLPRIHAMRKQAMNFLAAVRGERPAPCEAREAVEDLKIARDYIRLFFS